MNETPEEIARTLGIGSQARGRRVWIGLGIAAVLVAVGVWYSVRMGGSDADVRYITAEVERGDLAVTVTATGTVEPTNLVEISSELSGMISTVEVDFNDAVDVGTVLARLDTRKLEAQLSIAQASLDVAIARVAIAEASLEDAREKYEAARDLDARGVTSRLDFSTREAAFKRAEAELQSALADQNLAEANLELHRADLENACICSPIDGIVLNRSVDPGQIVAASLSAPVLFTVAEDLSEMELQVNIDEADIGRIAVGNRAVFSVDAYDENVFPAEIVEVRYAPEIVDGVVTYKTVLAVDNSHLLLRPGMTATAEIVVAEHSDVLLVPNAALRYAPPEDTGAEESDQRSGLLGMLIPTRPERSAAGDDTTIWVLVDRVAEEIAIRAGDSDGRFTEILEGPLSEGDLVITDRIDG